MSKRTDKCARCGWAQRKITFGKSHKTRDVNVGSLLEQRIRLQAAQTELRAREISLKASIVSWRGAALTLVGILVTTGCLFWKSVHDDTQAKRGADVRIEMRIEACQDVTVVSPN